MGPSSSRRGTALPAVIPANPAETEDQQLAVHSCQQLLSVDNTMRVLCLLLTERQPAQAAACNICLDQCLSTHQGFPVTQLTTCLTTELHKLLEPPNHQLMLPISDTTKLA